MTTHRNGGGGNGGSGGKSGGSSSSQSAYFGYSSDWQQGVWYERLPDGTYGVSSDQNPRNSNTSGYFVEYKDETWYIVVRGSDNPNPNNLDAGNATPPGESTPWGYTAVIEREDGTSWTEIVVAPGDTSVTIPSNALVIPETDGSTLVLYNNDGSAWSESGEGGTSEGSSGNTGPGDTGGGEDGGDGGAGGTTKHED